MTWVIENPPPRGSASGSPKSFIARQREHSDDRANARSRQLENADLREIKRDTIWRLARTAREHLDRLLWALGEEDIAEIREHCRSVVSHARAVAILVNDLGGGQ